MSQPLTDLQRKVMQQAKEAIQANDLARAKVLLKGVKHPKAVEWLDKIDEKEMFAALEVSGKPKETEKIKPKTSRARGCANIIAGIFLFSVAVYLGITTLYPPNAKPIPFDRDRWTEIYQQRLSNESSTMQLLFRNVIEGNDGRYIVLVHYENTSEGVAQANDILGALKSVVTIANVTGMGIDAVRIALKDTNGDLIAYYESNVSDVQDYLNRKISADDVIDRLDLIEKIE